MSTTINAALFGWYPYLCLTVFLLGSLCKRLGVAPAEHGVVVEHDLEVRDEPMVVGAVAMETAAEMIADSAVGHGVEGAGEHSE